MHFTSRKIVEKIVGKIVWKIVEKIVMETDWQKRSGCYLVARLISVDAIHWMLFARCCSLNAFR